MGVQIRALRRQRYRVRPFVFKDGFERRTELAIAIDEQISLPSEKAVHTVRQVSGYLLHPKSVGIRRAAREVHASRGHLHDEKQIARDQPAFRPDFDGCEVDGRQDVPVGFDERLPRRLPFPVRSRLNSVLLKDVADGRI